MGYQQDDPVLEDSLSLKLTPTHAARFRGFRDLQWLGHPTAVTLHALI